MAFGQDPSRDLRFEVEPDAVNISASPAFKAAISDWSTTSLPPASIVREEKRKTAHMTSGGRAISRVTARREIDPLYVVTPSCKTVALKPPSETPAFTLPLPWGSCDTRHIAAIAGESPTAISASQYVDQARRRFLTRNRRRFTALRQQLGRESLRLGDTLYLNGDGID